MYTAASINDFFKGVMLLKKLCDRIKDNKKTIYY